MAVSLKKGGNVSLKKVAEEAGVSGLKSVLIGLGWNPRVTDGAQFDADASVFLCGENGKVRKDDDFVFYNNKEGDGGNVQHMGDNRTGEGDGDDEQILIALDQLSADIVKIPVVVTIDEAEERGQNFGMIDDAFMRIVDADSQIELARFDLSEDASLETAMIFGELYLKNGEWKFKAIEQGSQGGLAGVAVNYGVNLA